MDIHVIWFGLLGVLLAGYAVLDGFDLGVGILHLLARSDHERRLFLNSIGPIWDGNEVWLITFGGALFAGFPNAYATAFSGFYLAFMLLLFALIFRAVSIEFRSKIKSQTWRTFWDYGFFSASLVAALLFGVAVGDAMIGLKLDSQGDYTGSFFDLLNNYALLAGALAVSLFAMHGCLYLSLRLPESEARERVRGWMWHTWGVFLVVYLLATIYTLIAIPRSAANFGRFPWAAAIVVVNVLAVANIPRAVMLHKAVQAFASSALTIVCLVSLFGIALFPNMVTASNNPAHTLTIYNASSSEGTLWTMLAIALVGMPFVMTYTAVVYWTFRGRVELHDHSY